MALGMRKELARSEPALLLLGSLELQAVASATTAMLTERPAARFMV